MKGTLAAAFLVVGAFLLLRVLARSITFPRPRAPMPEEIELSKRIPNARVVSYETADGLPSKGIHVGAGPRAGARVLYFHGNAESAMQNLPLAEELARGGIETFLAEYRGYSGLPGRPSEAGLCRDGEAALTAFLGARVDAPPAIFVGRSLGSGVAVEIASRRPPRLLILISPYTSLVDMGRSLVGPLAPVLVPDRFDNLSKIAALKCPIVIIHGTRDEVVPFEMGRRLAAAGRNVRFIALEGRTHNDLPELPRLLAEEIRRALGPG
ncbi:MAG TPA: alpha/beta hydrolase [Thermoanaerobaculia bacterium]|nr:alpha/beta hydrolase [Thermoanaerobaculia bacterium]